MHSVVIALTAMVALSAFASTASGGKCALLALDGRTELFRQAPFEWHVTPRHDYAKTFVTKLFMSQAEFDPELMGKYKVRDNGKVTTYLTCEQALEAIKGMDAITLGMPKIVYLVGWQYNGHDSKYPAFFEGNPAIRRACDRDALESIRWLMREARKYHTAVSLHVNMADAYVDSPLFEEYRKADVLAKDRDGKLIEGVWGYKVSYAAEWKKGLAQKRLDRLLALLPIAEAGTLHIDAYHSGALRPYRKGGRLMSRLDTPISPGHGYSEADEVAAQLNIVKYLDSKGVDVTIEAPGDFSAERAFVGYIPQYFHFGSGYGQHLTLQPTQATGVNIFGTKRCFGTHLNGEQVFRRHKGDLPGALERFKDEFCCKTLVVDYLNRFGRVSVTSRGGDASAVLSDGVRTLWKGGKMFVERNGRRLVDDANVCLPATWRGPKSLAVYSRAGCSKRSWPIPEGVTLTAGAKGWTVSASGLVPFEDFEVKGEEVTLALAPRQMVLIEDGVPDGTAGGIRPQGIRP